MPSDKFTTSSAENVYVIQGFSMGTADADQGGERAIVASLMCIGKPNILLILPENAYMDFVEHLAIAKTKLEDKRNRKSDTPIPSLNVISGGKEGSE